MLFTRVFLMPKTIIAVSFAVLLVQLTGCQTTKTKQQKASDPADVLIAQASKSISDLNRELVEIEAANYVQTTGKKLPVIDMSYMPSLNKLESLSARWAGPLDKLIIRLSAMARLNQPRFIGVKPAGDVIISIGTQRRPMIEFFQDAGTQAGSRAHVTLKMNERYVLVEYVSY